MLIRYISKDAFVLCGHPQAANDMLEDPVQVTAKSGEVSTFSG